MRFENAKEMYEYLVNTGDLYNKRTGHYIFDYNDAHALCIYNLRYDEMAEAAKLAIAQGEETISAVLGGGGIIYDDSKYDHFRYSESDEERALYLKASISFCHDWYKSDDLVPVEEFFTLAKIEEVEDLYENTPEGQIVDADTILVDALDNVDNEFSGFAQDIFNIWRESSDKKAVEQMFYEFTEMKFPEYLEKCKEFTTKSE